MFKVINEEVKKLVKTNVIREYYYPVWLANVVVAPKKGGNGGFASTLLT